MYLAYLCDRERYSKQFDEISHIFSNTRTNIPENWCKSNTAQKILQVIEKTGGIDRKALLDNFPERVVQGRLWNSKKVISCWDHPKDLINSRNKVIDFVSSFGSPKEFRYEVANDLLNYNEFASGNFKSSANNYDMEMLHTLAPAQKKKQLLAMGAKPKVQSPLAYRYASMGESVDNIIYPVP